MTKLCGRDVCNVCWEETPGDINLKQCSRCHGGAKYCNSECQRKDWSIHKIFCSVTANAPARENTVQALLLPQDSPTPVLVRAPLQGPHIVDAADFLGGALGVEFEYDVHFSEKHPTYQSKPMEELDCGFIIHYGTNANTAALPENECIKRILAGWAKAAYGSGQAAQILGGDYWKTHLTDMKKWRGNLIVTKCDRYKKKGLDNPTHEDFDIGDIPQLVVFLSYLSKMLAMHGW